jgi:leucyl aminopeptidase
MTQGSNVRQANDLRLPSLSLVADAAPFQELADDELLIVMGRPGESRAAWVQDLQRDTVRSLTRTIHYATYHVGFKLRPGAHGATTVPYVIIDWQKPGVSSLERRWVANKLAVSLAGLFSANRLTVFLEKGSDLAELVIAEDFYARTMTPAYDQSRLSGARILTAEPTLIEKDPHRAVRLSRQLTFRRWINENPDALTSIEFGHRLKDFCDAHQCGFEAYDRDRLAALGLNLLVAVGQASDRSPSRLYVATHRVKPGDRPLLLVGKGITFDTGGINLKPHELHVNCMKNDMGGAGLMMNLFMALVESGYNGPLVLAIPTCENAISDRAMKPGSIIRSHSGKSVLIEHTDAEGRLILADTLSYVQGQFNPELTLVAATLTTASLRQFTNFFTAVHFAPPAFQDALTKAGREMGEDFTYWGDFLPFAQGNKTCAADLTNMGRMPSDANIGGGCNVAAHFLAEFTKGPMIHFDIFASTWNWSGDYPGAHYGATGAPFNSLFRCLSKGPRSFV